MKKKLINTKEFNLIPLNEVELFEIIGGSESFFRQAGRLAGKAVRAISNALTIPDGGGSFEYDAAALGPIA